MRSSAPLAAVVLTYNEQDNLPACLASLRGLDCELFVVDSGSTDGTLALAEAAGATVLHHAFDNYAAQRNWAQAHLPADAEWVLHLDADERLTAELVSEINQVLAGAPVEADGFLLRKRTIFLGRWMKHGGHYPAYHLRLFRRRLGSCEDRLYDQHFIVRGRVARLRHDYIDVLTSDLTTWSMRHSRWAELEAQEITRHEVVAGTPDRVHPKLFGTPIERRRWLRDRMYGRAPLFGRVLLYWFYRYVLRLGFLDGTEGLIFHFLQGWWYRWLIDSKLYEVRKRQRWPVVSAAEPSTRIPDRTSEAPTR
ncbi:MAG: glycosyltransferase family 2 protein [Chloroflexi bacterium]|nr:glycosyltransferase family 2 protein [Chloroflexota bacterium]